MAEVNRTIADLFGEGFHAGLETDLRAIFACLAVEFFVPWSDCTWL